MSNTKKEYKPDMTAVFRRGVHEASGMSFHSIFINDELYDKIQAIEKGGMLVVKMMDPDSVSGDNKFLSGYIAYKTPDELAAEKLKFGGGKGSRKPTASEETI